MLIKRYRFELILLTLMIIFIYAKASTLGVHLFWDETLYLIPRFLKNGFSEFIPRNYHPHLWFGHPPLFQIIHYIINNFTETIRFSAHLTALISYLFFSFSTFLYFSKLIGKVEALCILVLFTIIPHSYAQSTMFLPNYLAVGLGLLSHYFFIQKKLISYIFLVSLAFLTRESALAFIVSAGLIGLWWFRTKRLSLKEWLLSLFPLIFPLCYFAIIKLKTDRFIGHPYFTIENGSNGSPLGLFKDKSMFLDALSMTTTLYWFTPLLILLFLIFLFRVWKDKVQTKIKHQLDFDCLYPFLITTTFYVSFFSLYSHTIPRDIVLASLLFQFTIVLIAKNLFSNQKITHMVLIGLVIIQVLYLSPYQKNSYNRDQSESSQIFNAKIMKEITDTLRRKYDQKTKLFAFWPASEVLKHPEYEYSANAFNISDQGLDDAKVFINAEIFSNYKKNFLRNENSDKWKLIEEKRSSILGRSYQIFERVK